MWFFNLYSFENDIMYLKYSGHINNNNALSFQFKRVFYIKYSSCIDESNSEYPTYHNLTHVGSS